MAITINSNLASLRGQRLLSNSSDQLTQVYAKLSSGQRINRPSDDAAGLAIADSLKASQRVASVAIRNAQDGISSVTIADGALNQIGQVLSRLAELSEQAATEPTRYSSAQRCITSSRRWALKLNVSLQRQRSMECPYSPVIRSLFCRLGLIQSQHHR